MSTDQIAGKTGRPPISDSCEGREGTGGYHWHWAQGELPCEACLGKRRAYLRSRHEAKPCDQECLACGGMAKQLRKSRCDTCYRRWRRAGSPSEGTPAERNWSIRCAEKREDYLWLRSQGESQEIAAERIGITMWTAVRWDRREGRVAS